MSDTEIPAAPTTLVVSDLPADFVASLRVVDIETGETIAGVIAADAVAGTVTRFDTLNGNLVREGDAFRVIQEQRAIRIEWVEAPASTAMAGNLN